MSEQAHYVIQSKALIKKFVPSTKSTGLKFLVHFRPSKASDQADYKKLSHRNLI